MIRNPGASLDPGVRRDDASFADAGMTVSFADTAKTGSSADAAKTTRSRRPGFDMA
jgi:hypothetical protein